MFGVWEAEDEVVVVVGDFKMVNRSSKFLLMLAAGTPELLGMAGHERDMQRINNLAVLVYLPALVVLSWTMAAKGAAIASVLVSAVTAVGATFLCARFYGFVPIATLLSAFSRKRLAR